MSAIVFCDTETTGLDPDVHEIWEVALIVGEQEYEWTLPVDLGRADARALTVGHFHERNWQSKVRSSRSAFAKKFRELTDGKHLAGAVISFDEERLRKLLRSENECPMWHYHLVDVEAFAAGKLQVAPPWNSEDLSRAIGVDPGQYERHSALGDARWAQALYRAVMLR